MTLGVLPVSWWLLTTHLLFSRHAQAIKNVAVLPSYLLMITHMTLKNRSSKGRIGQQLWNFSKYRKHDDVSEILIKSIWSHKRNRWSWKCWHCHHLRNPHMQPGELSEGQLRDINGESVIKKMQRKWHCQNFTSWNFLKLFYNTESTERIKCWKLMKIYKEMWLCAKAKKRSLLHSLSYQAKKKAIIVQTILDKIFFF